MFTRLFWTQALERAVKSAAGALLTLWTGNAVDVLHLDWRYVASLAVGAAVASLLMSVASAPFGPANSPSLVAVQPQPPKGADRYVGRL